MSDPYLLVHFHETAHTIVSAYVALLDLVNGAERPEDVRLANVRLWEIAQRLIPDEPFRCEASYPAEHLFVGEVPPVIANVDGATAHYAVFQLARQTLAAILDAAEKVSPSLPANLRRDRYGDSPAEFHALSRETAEGLCKLLYRMPTVQAEKIVPLLTLAPLDKAVVLRLLSVEVLRAEGKSEVQLQAAGDRPAPASALPEKPATAAEGTKGKRINERILGMLQQKTESLGWSAQQWADALGCSKSTIVETHTWKTTLSAAKARDKAERELRQGRKQRSESEDD